MGVCVELVKTAVAFLENNKYVTGQEQVALE